ncbi:winged helix DNA-binding domain-containing protein [Pseudarthrobacter sp. NIBRBAC000502772]|uniref:winged helix DNA-binding domain-containing protein n=1 Tax=Pseudarthrobacter sp. NIBRBAC000502772 TaxID=2590775 RepID=UPI00352D7B92
MSQGQLSRTAMDPDEVVRRRLHAQRLRGPGLGAPEDAVRHLLAVQAQEFPYARWSLAQRTGSLGPAGGAPSRRGASEAAVATAPEVEEAVSDGRILRTHILRPTWHFVHREDLRWLTALSAPRLHQGNAGMYRQSGIDAAAAGRSGQVLAEAVRGGPHLTREQLAARLQDEGFAATGFGLAYLIMHAEISGILTSGSPVRSRGGALKQTYALFDERVPAGPAMPPTRAEALSELVRRYFTSRGPATVKDCADWSGLTMADVRLGLQQTLAAAPETLATSVIDGVEHYFDARAEGGSEPGNAAAAAGPRIDLIQCYDEYVMGYSATRHYLGGSAPAFPVAGDPMHVVLLDGRMAGCWRHTMFPGRCELDIRLSAAAGPAVEDAVQDAVDRYGAFLGIPAVRVGSGVKLEGHI